MLLQAVLQIFNNFTDVTNYSLEGSVIIRIGKLDIGSKKPFPDC